MSVWQSSVSCAYHNGKVSLSPPVKSIPLGSHESNELVAESTEKNRLERSWSSQPSTNMMAGADNPTIDVAIKSTFLFLNILPRMSATAITAKPIQNANA